MHITSINALELNKKELEKTVCANRAVIQKNMLGKECAILEMFLKKEHLRECLSLAREFLLSLKEEISENFLNSLEANNIKLKEMLDSVSFGEAALEEKKRIVVEKEKEIARAPNAVEFKKLNNEKNDLDEEISRMMHSIDGTKKEISENEKKKAISVWVREKIDSDFLKKICEEYEKMEADLIKFLDVYEDFSKFSVLKRCENFIDRTFVTDDSVLRKWLTEGKKAVVVRDEVMRSLIWKEWNKEEDKMIIWFFTEKNKEYHPYLSVISSVSEFCMEVNIVRTQSHP